MSDEHPKQGAVAAREPGYRPRLSHAVHVAGAAVAQIPESAAYGLIALSPLGVAFGPQAMAMALLGAVAANVVACLAGAGRLVSGPRASLALLTAGLLSALVSRPGPDGPLAPLQVLLLLALGLVAAGLLQMLFAALKLGTVAKFMPHPVRVGLSSGIGLVLIAMALPILFGQSFGTPMALWLDQAGEGGAWAALVGLMAAVGATVAARWWQPLPPVVVGVVMAALLQALLLAWQPGLAAAGALSPFVGVPEWPTPLLAQWSAAWPGWSVLLSGRVLALLGIFAFTVATLATLDTLLAASVLDGRLKLSRDANRELRAQGLANIASALVGGQPTSPSLPRSMALVLPVPELRHSVLAYAAALLVGLLLLRHPLGWLPSSAVGGILVLQGVQMIAPAIWRAPRLLWLFTRRDARRDYDVAQRRLVAENLVVATAVALTIPLLGLGTAVLVGAALAVLLFVRANMRDVVRRVRTAATCRSLKMRPDALTQALRQNGDRIVLLELEGALFFGTADELRLRLQRLGKSADTAILDLQQVNDIDATGARILLETGEEWAREGRTLVLAEWLPGDARRRVIEAIAASAGLSGLVFAGDTDSALEAAEQRLLDSLNLEADGVQCLSLGDTQLGNGLSAAELNLLMAQMTAASFRQGEVLFRAGDPGDALYVSIQGQIGLRLPDSTRRLASFAPGMMMGEMALLEARARSAEAVAESDLQVLRLSVSAFQQMKLEHPALTARVLNNIALHLADRVRSLTGELSGWVARTAAARITAPDFDAALDGDLEATE